METLSAQQPQFTCFTGTNVRILTLLSAQPQWVPWFTVDGNPLVSSEQIAANDTTGTIVQMLTLRRYKSTNTDAARPTPRQRSIRRCSSAPNSVYLLYWYNSTNTDAAERAAFDSQMLLGSKLCDLYAAKTARQLPKP